MHHFAYRNGVMHAEDVDLRALAEAVGTPFYCYSTATLERHYRVFAQAFDADQVAQGLRGRSGQREQREQQRDAAAKCFHVFHDPQNGIQGLTKKRVSQPGVLASARLPWAE